MIKALMLIFEPGMAWEGIALAKKSVRQVFYGFLVPIIFLSIAGEMAGIFFWGRHQELQGNMKLPRNQAIAYGICETILSFGMVFIGAKIVKSLAQNVHIRHTFNQAFTVVAYSFAPLFLVRLLDAFPAINPWATFGVGMALCVATLYHGVPRILQPDPPNAFGLYLVSALLLTGVAGLARFLSWLLLSDRFSRFF